mgnify:CR=1 FL=1
MIYPASFANYVTLVGISVFFAYGVKSTSGTSADVINPLSFVNSDVFFGTSVFFAYSAKSGKSGISFLVT